MFIMNNNFFFQETHILHNFDRDLYGCLLKVCIVGFLRPEKNFSSLEELISAIKNDIESARNILNDNSATNCLKLKNSEYFNSPNDERSSS